MYKVKTRVFKNFELFNGEAIENHINGFYQNGNYSMVSVLSIVATHDRVIVTMSYVEITDEMLK